MMSKNKKDLHQIYKSMESKPKRRAEASWVAYDLYEYICLEQPEINQVNEIREDFITYMRKNDLLDLHQKNYEYVLRLSLARGDLIFEETSKLYSLCDEIESLGYFGFELNESERNEMNNALLERLSRQRGEMKSAANHGVEPWKEHWFCYKEILGR